MVGQRLNKETDAVDHGGDTSAGDSEAGEQDADAIPIEAQLQGDGPDPGRFHELLLGSAKGAEPGRYIRLHWRQPMRSTTHCAEFSPHLPGPRQASTSDQTLARRPSRRS